jgi:hypothetical protein
MDGLDHHKKHLLVIDGGDMFDCKSGYPEMKSDRLIFPAIEYKFCLFIDGNQKALRKLVEVKPERGVIFEQWIVGLHGRLYPGVKEQRIGGAGDGLE